MADASGPKSSPEPVFFVGPEAWLLEKGSSPCPAWAYGHKPGTVALKGSQIMTFFEKQAII